MPVQPGDKFATKEFEAYTLYLMGVVASPIQDGNYFLLCSLLNTMEFYNSMDESNRMEDGIDLREQYFDEHPESDIFNSMDCGATVLEVMAALAERAEMIAFDPNDDANRWFWVMCSNLDILISDNDWNKQDSLRIIKTNVKNWLEHRYKVNGEGSAFPLSSYKGNQRQLSLWDSMEFYIGECVDTEV